MWHSNETVLWVDGSAHVSVQRPLEVYVVIRVIFFFAVSRVSPSHTFTAKKQLHDMTIVLLHAFTAKKNYTTYCKKKLHDVTIFL